MTSVLGIGVVGLGAHAQRGHIDHLHRIGQTRLAAVCDPDPAARQRQLDTGFTGRAYASVQELLDDPAVQAVIVCSPDRFHADSLQLGVQAGKHMLVEKPVADSREDLPGVAAALDQGASRGLVISSCHPRRFDPPFLWLREQLPALAAQLGPALDLRFDFFYHRPSKTGLHHGLLIDHINHEIDLVNWLFGHSPFVAHRLFDDEVRYGAAGARQDGLCFSFFGSRHLERKTYSELLRVRFQRGEVEVDAETGRATIRDWDANTTRIAVCGATDYELRFVDLNRNFVLACLGRESSYLDRADLLLNTELGIALTEDGSFDSSRSVV